MELIFQELLYVAEVWMSVIMLDAIGNVIIRETICWSLWDGVLQVLNNLNEVKVRAKNMGFS